MAPPRYVPYTPRKQCRRQAALNASKARSEISALAPCQAVASSSAGLALRAQASAVSIAPVLLSVPSGPCPASAAFERLPVQVLRLLASELGASNFASLQSLPESDFLRALGASCRLSPLAPLLQSLTQQPFDEARFMQQLWACPFQDAGTTVHATLGLVSCSQGRAGPTPSATIRALGEAQRAGVVIGSVLDGVADRRASCSLRPGTRTTYSSHFFQIRQACRMLGASPLPASLDTVRRVASVVNNPSTLRGWLSAWRQFHIQARRDWAGDGDAFLRAARLGLAKSAPPPLPRRRLRKPRLLALLRYCIKQKLW
jgi:hypothetical protein